MLSIKNLHASIEDKEILKGINEGNVDVSGARQWYSKDTADALDILKKEIIASGDFLERNLNTEIKHFSFGLSSEAASRSVRLATGGPKRAVSCVSRART